MVKQEVPKEQVRFIANEEFEKYGEEYEKLQEKVQDLEFDLECRPNPEGCEDRDLRFEVFFFFDLIVNRVGYLRFEDMVQDELKRMRNYYA